MIPSSQRYVEEQLGPEAAKTLVTQLCQPFVPHSGIIPGRQDWASRNEQPIPTMPGMFVYYTATAQRHTFPGHTEFTLFHYDCTFWSKNKTQTPARYHGYGHDIYYPGMEHAVCWLVLSIWLATPQSGCHLLTSELYPDVFKQPVLGKQLEKR